MLLAPNAAAPPGCSCYLSLPSGLTGPSSDLGSGDSELQEVLLQVSREEQDEELPTQTFATAQKVLMALSAHSSSARPVSCAFPAAAASASSERGRLRIPPKPWKLCSMYSLRGGPPCSQLLSSGRDREKEISSVVMSRQLALPYSPQHPNPLQPRPPHAKERGCSWGGPGSPANGLTAA